jgi:RimJ/RimL family protein N-acetyltransferase
LFFVLKVSMPAGDFFPQWQTRRKRMDALFDFERFPDIETPRLLLRELRREDAEAIFRLFSNPAVMRYYDMDVFTSREQAQALIERQRQRFEQKERFRWGVALKERNTIIGTGGYVAWNRMWYHAELGYDLASPYWGQGLMTEALKAMIQFGFERMGLHRIEAEVMPENEASVRLLRNLGFVAEGVLRERSFWKGAFHDLIMCALLKSTWES